MKISFDFDGVFEHKHVRIFAQELLNAGHDIWILTTRYDRRAYWLNQNYFEIHRTNCYHEVIKIALETGIPIKNVLFTNYEWKADFLKNKGLVFDIHIDDNPQEVNTLKYLCMHENYKTKIKMILTNSSSWMNKVRRIIKK